MTRKLCSHVSLFLPHCNVYPSNLPLIPSSFLPSLFVFHSSFLSLPISGANIPIPICPFPLPSLPLVPFFSTCWILIFTSLSQSVIVKSVERNAVNMYEARKFILGLESNSVSSSSIPVAVNPTPNGPSLICPVGLDILASAGLGLSNLGNNPDLEKMSLVYFIFQKRQYCV